MIEFDLSTVPAKDRDRVAALIPDPVIAQAYINRQVRGYEDFDLLDVCTEKMRNVLLVGETGSSKTTVFRAYAAARGLPFALVECNAAMDPGVIIGRTTIIDGGEVHWIDGDMSLVVRYGGVLLLDEVNMAHPRITATWHQLYSVIRRMSVPENGEVIVAGKGGTGKRQPLLLAAAMNPKQYEGTGRLSQALNNRFPVQIPWNYDAVTEAKLVASPTLLELAQSIRNLAEIRTPMSTNSLMEFEEHVELFDIHMAAYLLVCRFAPEEQAPVSRALEAKLATIAEELGVDLGEEEEVVTDE